MSDASNPFQPTFGQRAVIAARTAIISYLSLILVAAVFGAVMSFFTGRADETPKWNGLDYVFFSAKEFAMFGAILASPAALIVLVASWFRAR